MKLKTFIFLNILVILLLSFTAYSQDSEKEIAISEKERKELEKFTDEFVKDLRTTNDLSKVSEKFFVPDFKTRLARIENSFFDEDVAEPISDGERYNYIVAVTNFYYLIARFYEEYRKTQADDEEYFDFTEAEKIFPPHLLELCKRSKWLRFMLDYEDKVEDDSLTLEDIQSIMADLNIVSDAIRIEMKQRKPNTSDKSKISESDYSVEECEDDSCLGLPENTKIFDTHRYSMCLRIIRVNNELKIAEIKLNP